MNNNAQQVQMMQAQMHQAQLMMQHMMVGNIYGDPNKGGCVAPSRLPEALNLQGKCEISGCEQNAVQKCSFAICCCWRGCGRLTCNDHSRNQLARSKGGHTWVANLSCTECTDKASTGRCFGIFILIFSLLAFFGLLQLSIHGSLYLKYRKWLYTFEQS